MLFTPTASSVVGARFRPASVRATPSTGGHDVGSQALILRGAKRRTQKATASRMSVSGDDLPDSSTHASHSSERLVQRAGAHRDRPARKAARERASWVGSPRCDGPMLDSKKRCSTSASFDRTVDLDCVIDPRFDCTPDEVGRHLSVMMWKRARIRMNLLRMAGVRHLPGQLRRCCASSRWCCRFVGS